MSKICRPETGESVLYVDCLECDSKAGCPDASAPKPWFALLIVGSRSVTDYAFVKNRIDMLIAPIRHKYRFLIVSGGADGADSLAEFYAKENGIDFKLFPADWKIYGKQAGYVRNRQMHKYVAGFEHRGCIAFWDGSSRGTMHSFVLAEEFATPIRVIKTRENKSE